jgi:hypothetical protein
MNRAERRRVLKSQAAHGRLSLTNADTEALLDLEPALVAFAKTCERDTANFSYANDDSAADVSRLLWQEIIDQEKEHHYDRTIQIVAGLILELEGGVCGTVTHYSSHKIHLPVSGQKAANAILFSLMKGNFLPKNVPKSWGDVTLIRQFSIHDDAVAITVNFETIWQLEVSVH